MLVVTLQHTEILNFVDLSYGVDKQEGVRWIIHEKDSVHAGLRQVKYAYTY